MLRRRDPNVVGQAYGFQAMTPIRPGEEDALRAYLEGLYDDDRPSPLAKLERTHIARWVIITDFVNDRAWGQRRAEHLELPYLVFTSNFDGDLDSYLDELCSKLATEAAEVWGRCVGCPVQAEGAALKAYLKHNQVDCGLFFTPYGDATVPVVKDALAQREQMIAFATDSQGLDPAALQAAFVREFGG
ncbi:MAG: hypothetical protein Q8O56_09835 [Solirubrobacteraceae bacterium]|nr:hypothetical protein [Solirubrobacteraceae bacterium]